MVFIKSYEKWKKKFENCKWSLQKNEEIINSWTFAFSISDKRHHSNGRGSDAITRLSSFVVTFPQRDACERMDV